MVTGERTELVLALVAPVGTDLDAFERRLQVALSRFGYNVNTLRVSELVPNFVVRDAAQDAGGSPEFVRLDRAMSTGNAARARGGKDVLASAAVAHIHASRSGDPDQREPRFSTAHIIRSLKHPAEAATLRNIYGAGFYLIGVVSDVSARALYLRHDRGCTEDEVLRLFERDDYEELEHGQRTRDTFHLADVFLSIDDHDGLMRFLGLVFGDPHQTPRREEHMMFLAFAAALRSADLSRQVGAVLVSDADCVVAVGANDVPRAGGGQYWPGPADRRDHRTGFDANERHRAAIIDDILARLKPAEVERDVWLREGRRRLDGARVMDITEYGRPVHAEMEALLAAGRSGVSTRGSTLFSTTFPCHNCAKHIVDAGVERVVYVEPYPKSQALDLFSDSITGRADVAQDSQRVLFEPFSGVGPRRFFDLFSLKLSSGREVSRKRQGRLTEFDPRDTVPRVAMQPSSYIVREALAAKALQKVTEENES